MTDLVQTATSRALATIASDFLRSFYRTAKRRYDVRTSILTNEAAPDVVTKNVISDLRTQLGALGLIDNQFDRFLTCLFKSEVFQLISACAHCNVKPEELRIFFRFVFEHFLSDGVLIDGTRCYGDETFDRLFAGIQSSLNSQRTSYIPESPESQIEFERQVSEYVKTKSPILFDKFLDYPIQPDGKIKLVPKAVGSNPWLRVRSNKADQLIKSFSQNVMPLFSYIPLYGPYDEYGEAETTQIFIPIPIALEGSAEGGPSESFETIDLALIKTHRLIILGNPGAGKTTILRQYAYERYRHNANEPEELVVFVEIRRWVRAFSAQKLDLLDLIFRAAFNQAKIQRTPENETIFRSLLELGRAVLIFDGLDEIISVAERRRLAGELAQAMQLYPLARFVFSCRPHDFERAPINAISIFRLNELTDQQIGLYFRAFHTNLIKKQTKDLDDLSAKFLEQSKLHARDLIRNPLLLTLITWLYTRKGHIPDNRAEIYGQCAGLIFHRWDKERQIDVNMDFSDFLFQLVTNVATVFMTGETEQVVVSHSALYKAIHNYFLDFFERDKNERALRATEQFMNYLPGRAWMIRGSPEGGYEFIHRTFLEYFYARHIAGRIFELESIRDLVDRVVSRGDNLSSCHLALQLWAADYGDRHSAVCDALIQLSKDKLFEKNPREGEPFSWTPSLASSSSLMRHFLADSVKYLRAAERQIVEITKIIILSSMDSKNAFDTLEDVLEGAQANKDAIVEGIVQGILVAINVNRIRAVGIAIDWLYAQRVSCRKPLRVRGTLKYELINSVKDEFVERVRGAISDDKIQASAAKVIFDLSGHLVAEEIKTLGPAIWASTANELRLDWRFIDSALALYETALVLNGGDPDQNRYFQLAYLSSFGVPAKSPLRLSTLDMPTNDVDYSFIDDDTIARALRSSETIRRGFAFALMCLYETSGGPNEIFAPPFRLQIPTILKSLDREGLDAFGGFVSAWCDNEKRIFRLENGGFVYSLDELFKRSLIATSFPRRDASATGYRH